MFFRASRSPLERPKKSIAGPKHYRTVARQVRILADVVHADTLQPGELSKVVTLPFGCSLLEVVERREYQFVTYEAARPRLVQELSSSRESQLYQEWLEQLRKNTFIERRGRFADAAQFAPIGSAGQGAARP